MIGIDDIEAAAGRLAGVAIHTPLIENDELNRVAGGRVLVKPECLQRTGSFKIRGAYNLISQLDAAERHKGVVAFSSGNHAQGIAAAGRMLGVATTIVMPSDAPATKLANTERLGGKVITYDRYTDSREAIAERIAAETGSTIAPSFNHPDIIAGQGTAGLEIRDDLLEAGLVPDQFLICCGGGGLSAGSALALRSAFPGVAIHPVEPANFDDTARSLESGQRESNDKSARSICDAILTDSPGDLTFDILCRVDAHGLVVSDDEVRAAMRFAFRHLKLVVEPGGAVALAAVLSGKVSTNDRLTVLTLSGGNVDPALFDAIQAERG
ncbi:MAG: threonine/serine dehydratase [Pseudomonadota bacterium]